MKVWDAATGQEIRTLKGHTGAVYERGVQPRRQAARLRPDGDRTVKVWDAATGQEILTLKGHKDDQKIWQSGSVYGVAFSPDGKRLASASLMGRRRCGTPRPGRKSSPSRGIPRSPQRGVQPRRQTARLRQPDRTVKVWDAGDRAGTLTLKGHGDVVNSVAFSPDGKRLASAGHGTER